MVHFYGWIFCVKIIYLEKCITKMDGNVIRIKPKKRALMNFLGVLEIVSKILFLNFHFLLMLYTKKKKFSWKLNHHRMIKKMKKLKNFHMCRIYNCNDWIFSHFSRNRITIKILNQEYKVFYIGTNTGRIYKIVQFMQNGESKSTLLDIFEVAQNEPIQVMQISQKRKSLYVSTDHRIKQIDLAMCSRRYDSCFRCVKDPYCGWDQDTNLCKPFELGLLQVSFMPCRKITTEMRNSLFFMAFQWVFITHPHISLKTHKHTHTPNESRWVGKDRRGEKKILIRKFFYLT